MRHSLANFQITVFGNVFNHCRNVAADFFLRFFFMAGFCPFGKKRLVEVNVVANSTYRRSWACLAGALLVG